MRDAFRRHKYFFYAYLLFLSCYSLLSFFRHFSLHSGVYDLGLFTQWSYLAGIGEFWTPSSLTEFIKPALGDHFSLLLVPIGQLFRLLPSAYTLLFLQSAGLASLSILFLRELFQSFLSRTSRRLITIGLLINPFLINSALNDFHPEVAFAFLGFASLLFLRKKRYLVSVVLLMLFVASKEAMAFFAIGYSLYALLRRHFWLSAAVMGFALYYFAFSSSIVDVYQSYASTRYGHLGNGYVDILASPFIRPAEFWRAFINRDSFLYLLGLLTPFVALYRWPQIIPAIVSALPLIFANILSESDVMRSPIYQYQIPVLLFIMLAALDSSNCQSTLYPRKFSLARIRLYSVSSVVSFFLLTQWSFFPTRYLQHLSLAPSLLGYEREYSAPHFSIWAHERIASHFSGRREIFYRNKDLVDKEFDILITPAAQPAVAPVLLVHKLRNFIFSYGYSDEFMESENIVEAARIRGYQCQGHPIVVCKK